MATRRLNPLTGQFVLVSASRSNRPWSQELEVISEPDFPSFDPQCYLCPGTKRINGEHNPLYKSSYIFHNDFPAMQAKGKSQKLESGLLFEQRERGRCEVVCYSPSHNLNLMHLSSGAIQAVIRTWVKLYRDLGKLAYINYVQIFETRGKEVGNSAPHPHCQVWAQENIPSLPASMLQQMEQYFRKNKRSMLLDYAEQELKLKSRLLFANKSYVVLVPFWAEWPYELMVIPLRLITALDGLSPKEIEDLAECFSWVTSMYAKLFSRPKYGAPYIMSIFQSPTDGKKHPGCQLFVKFTSPLLSPSRQKYQAGYEKSAESQRDLTPELAAEQMRAAMLKN